MQHRRRDPWELDGDQIPPWRLQIEERAQEFPDALTRPARWALFALQRFMAEMYWPTIGQDVREIGIYGSLANGIWVWQVDVAAVVRAGAAEDAADRLLTEMERAAAIVIRQCAVPIAPVVVTAEMTDPERESAQWAAIRLDYVVIWPNNR